MRSRSGFATFHLVVEPARRPVALADRNRDRMVRPDDLPDDRAIAKDSFQGLLEAPPSYPGRCCLPWICLVWRDRMFRRHRGGSQEPTAQDQYCNHFSHYGLQTRLCCNPYTIEGWAPEACIVEESLVSGRPMAATLVASHPKLDSPPFHRVDKLFRMSLPSMPTEDLSCHPGDRGAPVARHRRQRNDARPRAATQIAHILRGKHKATFTPHLDSGDFVVVINAHEVKLTGKKWAGKLYYDHTLFPGGLITRSAEKLRAHKPTELVRRAVWVMLPKGPLGRKIVKKLKILCIGRASARGPRAQAARQECLGSSMEKQTTREQNTTRATGRRKEAVARVRVMPGTGQITVNDRSMENYFSRATSRMVGRAAARADPYRWQVRRLRQCLGGVDGQADAVKLGISRALCTINKEYRTPLGACRLDALPTRSQRSARSTVSLARANASSTRSARSPCRRSLSW